MDTRANVIWQYRSYPESEADCDLVVMNEGDPCSAAMPLGIRIKVRLKSICTGKQVDSSVASFFDCRLEISTS